MKILLNKPVAPCLKTLTNYLAQVNESGWYTNFGPLHQKLTIRLEEYLGVENLLLVSNGTLALHIAYKTLNVKKAICTPFSFVATAGSLSWEKIPFSFVDVNSNSLNLCPRLVEEKLKNDKDIDTLIATHVYGNPCDVDAFAVLQKKYKVKVIYDGAHAFNINCGKKSILSFGDASTLSFHATKVFHTIEGGAIIFEDKNNFDMAKKIINFGIGANGSSVGMGTNAKLNEYQCAVGLTLLENMNEILQHRVELFNLYKQSLESYVDLPVWHADSSLNGAYFPIILKSFKHRSKIKLALEKSGIPSREYFSPSLNTIFTQMKSCQVSESISSRVLCLPIHFNMSKEEIIYICKILKESL